MVSSLDSKSSGSCSSSDWGHCAVFLGKTSLPAGSHPWWNKQSDNWQAKQAGENESLLRRYCSVNTAPPKVSRF